VTFNMCWQNALNEIVLRLCADVKSPRAAVVGIGSSIHGDDAAGVMIVRTLKQNAVGGERLLVINASIALENVFGVLQRFAPDLVLIIDAAQMGLEPGNVRCIDPQNTTGFSFSTHTLPLQVFCDYVATVIGSQVAILGIQPADVSFGGARSPLVKFSLVAMLPVLVEILNPILQPHAGLNCL
jgi:hydrogenase 3 maturation protease